MSLSVVAAATTAVEDHFPPGIHTHQQLPGRHEASYNSDFHLCRHTSWRQYLSGWVCEIRIAIWAQSLWVPSFTFSLCPIPLEWETV